MLRYADTSALVRAYFADEVDHAELRELLLESDVPVVTSELARLEFASATWGAARGARLGEPRQLLDRFDADCRADGPLTLLRFQPATALPAAGALLAVHPLRTLDALHLVVARDTARPLAAGAGFVLVTRDQQQAAVAEALGMVVV